MRPHELGKQIEEARLDLQALLYPGGPRVPHADVDPDDYEHLRQSIRLSGEAVLLLAPQGEQPDVVAATSLAREASTHLDVLL